MSLLRLCQLVRLRVVCREGRGGVGRKVTFHAVTRHRKVGQGIGVVQRGIVVVIVVDILSFGRGHASSSRSALGGMRPAGMKRLATVATAAGAAALVCRKCRNAGQRRVGDVQLGVRLGDGVRHVRGVMQVFARGGGVAGHQH